MSQDAEWSRNVVGSSSEVPVCVQRALGLKWQSSTRLIIHFHNWSVHDTAHHHMSVLEVSFDKRPAVEPAGAPKPCTPEKFILSAPYLLRFTRFPILSQLVRWLNRDVHLG